jgi:hypothetical protein
VVLEVVAHVQLAQAAAERGLRTVVVHVVVQHVVGQVARQEPGGEGQPAGRAEHEREDPQEQRRQRD